MGSWEIRSVRFFPPSVGSLAEEHGGVAKSGAEGRFRAFTCDSKAFADAVAAAAALAAATPLTLPLA